MPVVTYTAASTALVAKTRNARVRLWGGGGTGGPAQGSPSATGGGAGGQYAESYVALAPGTSYTVAVAQVATSLTTGAVNGSDTTFASTTVVAKGGAGSAAVTANSGAGTGAAGSLTGIVGTIQWKGGTGGTAASSASSGGGGGGAGSSADGKNASGITAGLGTTLNGGAGADGVTTANTRGTPSNYGGGGSGAYASGATDRRGGDGAAGLAIVDWIAPCSHMLLGVG